MNNAGYV